MECYNYILYVYYDYYKTCISYPFTFCDMYEIEKCNEQKNNLSKMKFGECCKCSTCQLKTYLKSKGKCPENCNAIALSDVEKIYKILNCNNAKESEDDKLSKCIFKKIPFKDSYLNAINLQKEREIIEITEILIISLFTNMCQRNHETFSVFANILYANKNDKNFTESSNTIYEQFKYIYESNNDLNNDLKNENIFERTDIGVMFLQALNLKEEYSKINGKPIYTNNYKICLMNRLKLHFANKNKSGYPNVEQ